MLIWNTLIKYKRDWVFSDSHGSTGRPRYGFHDLLVGSHRTIDSMICQITTSNNLTLPSLGYLDIIQGKLLM